MSSFSLRGGCGKRLHELVVAGLLDRHRDGHEVTYALSMAGEELRPVIEALGGWGIRWMGHLGDQDLDPKLLLWDMHRHVDRAALPRRQTVVHFRLTDVPARTRSWWIVITPVDVSVHAPLRRMVQIWLGDVRRAAALRSGDVRLEGAPTLCRALPGWFTLSTFAAVPRPATGERASLTGT